MRALLNNRWIVNGLTLAMLAVLIICLYRPSQFIFLRTLAGYSLHLLFLYLAAGLGFMFFGQKRLLFTAFACCACLCLVLKVKADASIQAISTTSQPMLHVLQTSVSSIAGAWSDAYESIVESDPDVIAILEVSPSWKKALDSYLLEDYPHVAVNLRIDDFGTAIYSKTPIHHVDTLGSNSIPSLHVTTELVPETAVHLILSNTFPPLFQQSYQDLRQQLTDIGQVAGQLSDRALLTLGNYNLDQFSDELQDFRALGGLEDSRKTMTPSLSPPTNHIFFNEMLDFQHFSNLYDASSRRIGIQGIYQYRDEENMATRVQ
ncbi:MAG: endonuclease/exonuclease/phosphatase family protein [Saprospiraceae bacterium]|nr:endonuclease/exonuclease/phosphatase family protein [Saprospiraceae bacterium]